MPRFAAIDQVKDAKNKLALEASKLTNKANVEIVMALAEDVPELGKSAYWLAIGGPDAMKTDSDASIVLLSALINTSHMVRCIQRYRSIVQMTQHANTAGEHSSDTQCCLPNISDDAKNFKLETYDIEGADGFMWAQATTIVRNDALCSAWLALTDRLQNAPSSRGTTAVFIDSGLHMYTLAPTSPPDC